MKALIISVTLLLISRLASAQTISGHVCDHEGNALPGIIVAYNLAGNVQQDTTDAAGAYLLSFGTSGVPEEDGPQVRGTTWGKLKAGFKEATGIGSKVAASPRTVIFPDTLYFLGGANYWSNTHPLTAPAANVTVNMALPPAVYSDIPTEGQIPINPPDYKDYHDLIGAPVPPALVPTSWLWHPSRIQAQIPVDVRPEWNQTEYDYIRDCLDWFEANMNVKSAYGMETMFQFVTRGSLGPTAVGWRVKRGSLYGCVPQFESVGGEYFVKHSEISLQYADPAHQWRAMHEFNHGLDGMVAHVDYPLYNGDGYSLMNMDAIPAYPPDKAYQKLAYQLQKLRLVDGKHDGRECDYCIRP